MREWAAAVKTRWDMFCISHAYWNVISLAAACERSEKQKLTLLRISSLPHQLTLLIDIPPSDAIALPSEITILFNLTNLTNAAAAAAAAAACDNSDDNGPK